MTRPKHVVQEDMTCKSDLDSTTIASSRSPIIARETSDTFRRQREMITHSGVNAVWLESFEIREEDGGLQIIWSSLVRQENLHPPDSRSNPALA